MENETYTGQEMGERPQPKNKKTDTIEICAVLIVAGIVFLIAYEATKYFLR